MPPPPLPAAFAAPALPRCRPLRRAPAPRRPHASTPPPRPPRPPRRAVLRLLAALPVSAALRARAAALPATLPAALAGAAAALPGGGAPDVFYPRYFLGDWVLARDLYKVTPAERAPGAVRARIGVREVFPVRFVERGGEVVADRAFNVRAEVRAEVGGGGRAVEVVARPEVPNVFVVVYGGRGGGRSREVRVTKRSFGVPEGGRVGNFTESEYARVAQVDAERGENAVISARRRMVEYSVTSVDADGEPDEISALCVEYRYPASPPDAKPTFTLKYRQFLTRKGRNRSAIQSALHPRVIDSPPGGASYR